MRPAYETNGGLESLSLCAYLEAIYLIAIQLIAPQLRAFGQVGPQ
jgi:hypothetical protein